MIDWSALRPLTAADAAACAAFSCCDAGGRYGASDIERQVRTGKAVRRAAAETDHVFLGAFDDGSRLAAVAYHEPAPQDRIGVPARYLRFVALHDAYQGARDPHGQRCPDLLMHTIHNDILARYPNTEAVLEPAQERARADGRGAWTACPDWP